MQGAAREVRDVSEPPRGPGEALVGVRVAGVCDTDLQLASGYMAFEGTPGHEFVGMVLAADTQALVGRRVVADINAGCGTCESCATERGHHCAKRTVVGILGRSGAFAERLVVPERCLVEVPDHVDDDVAVFAEPLAAALHVADDLPVEAERVAVLGDGKLGLLVALGLAGRGRAVTLLGHHEHKLAIARRGGVETFDERSLPTTLERSFDRVVEATGSAAGFARALELARPRGTVVLKTTVTERLSVDLSPVVIHELAIVGSRCGRMDEAIDALAKGIVDPRPLLQARYPLERTSEALDHAGRRGTLKVLVDVAGR